MNSLLPLNSTPLERAIEAAIDEHTEIPLRTLYNPDTCPAHLLPWLAWAWSVDRWDNQWSVPIKRAAIRSAFYVHAHKGTIGALRRVVEPLGYKLGVIEWWQTEPKGVPGTFSLVLDLPEDGDPDAAYDELVWLIDDAKPVSRHLTGLEVSLEVAGKCYLSACTVDAEEIDVFPLAPQDIDVLSTLAHIGHEHSIDTLEVFP